mmetsp:Transcript_29322/g.57535  ORF Transcript_29322/g.57535 Transcript_29322/m.57535 type:complete len:213 (+) Transcript_29322:290-928(+)
MPSFNISGEHTRSQPKASVVGDADGVCFVCCFDDGSNRAKELFVVGRLPHLNVCNYGWRVECTRAVRDLPPRGDHSAFGNAVQHLLVDLCPGLLVNHRAHLNPLSQGVANNNVRHSSRKLVQELVVNAGYRDEPFGTHARLPAVEDAPANASGNSCIDVSIFQDDVPITSTQLKDVGFDLSTSRGTHLGAHRSGAGHSDSSDGGVVDQHRSL